MISINQHILAGTVSDISFGHAPLPWMSFYVASWAVVWDANGRRVQFRVKERIVLQGTENVALFKLQIREGTNVYIHGQLVPAFTVAGDSHLRGNVTLATICQIQEEPRDEKD